MKWLFLLFCSRLMAQEIDLRGAGEPISANGVWKWHEGDNPAWAAPGPRRTSTTRLGLR